MKCRERKHYMIYKCVIMGSINERDYATRSFRSTAMVLAEDLLDISR